MLKPPFTILILKDSNHPLTVRITTGLIVLIVLFVSLGGVMIGVSMGYFLFHNKTDLISTAPDEDTTDFTPEMSLQENTIMKPDIRNLSVKHHKNDETDMILSFTSLPDNETLYVWIIVNPDAETVGERIIHPRNPVFRGMPVDYRNGFPFTSSDDNELAIPLPDEAESIVLEQFRVLVYSLDGKKVTDRYLHRNSNDITGNSSANFALYQ